jgi:ankyrin repeat protein
VTPLMTASYSGFDGVAARLIAAGAKLDLVDMNNFSALHCAFVPEPAVTAMMLIEAGAALNQVSSLGRTALDEADMRGLASVAAAIRARGGLTSAELAQRAEA